MAKDLVVVLEDRPGTLADMGEALWNANIDIEGICAVTFNGEGIIHILVEVADAARKALEAKGIKGSGEREVLVLDVEDRPGELGEIARKFADAGGNIDLAYLASKTRLVVGVNNIEKARSAV